MLAYYALIKLKMLPSTLFSLPENEKAFVIAAMKIHSGKEAAAINKIKKG
ncbi:hypothetical protein [Megasphaera vaginalis (ex Bordigoni et al. 2020)]|uniref:Uncharacterized protein n=1 Tax=Megasphaera vaginalis (ex Srinivasan et al. 2021) TaxID=1111454 RepID=U7US33_9FIRM|nr:hypothetical protein [Megasphaera vaginalis (ex Bordigoni et al. 2020)]ERT61268.1 hypothetical protein HMPREF1250_0165 [Megasphaera vaginalis (ex Srinivasan et al. 2021)]